MFDPIAVKQASEHVHDEQVRANLAGISPAQRNALIALLAGPAECLVGHAPSARWQCQGTGAFATIADTTMNALADRRLVTIDARRHWTGPGRSSRSGRKARLTPKGVWYAHSAAGEAADQLMALLKRPPAARA